MKRWIVILAVMLAVLLVMTACGKEKDSQVGESETYIVEEELPATVEPETSPDTKTEEEEAEPSGMEIEEEFEIVLPEGSKSGGM